MVRGWRAPACAALTTGLLFAGQASAQPPGIQYRSSTWVESNYPEFARDYGLRGQAVLSCRSTAKGTLDCKVVSETPAGFGFGEAALDVAYGAKASGPPRTAIQLPVTFEPRALPDVARAREPSAAALTLAQVVIELGAGGRAVFEKEFGSILPEREMVGLDRVSPSVRKAAVAAFEGMKDRLFDDVLRFMARKLDETASPSDLATAAEFFSRPDMQGVLRQVFDPRTTPEQREALGAEWAKTHPEDRAKGLAMIRVFGPLEDLDDAMLEDELKATILPGFRADLCARVACHPSDAPSK